MSEPIKAVIGRRLSNKLSAIFRYAAKGIVDISEILTSMPQSEFETVAWNKKPDWREFHSDIDGIVYEMIGGE